VTALQIIEHCPHFGRLQYRLQFGVSAGTTNFIQLHFAKSQPQNVRHAKPDKSHQVHHVAKSMR
jgi:hypothetical protein